MSHTPVLERSGRYDNLHGDEDTNYPTPAERDLIERLADQMVIGKLYGNLSVFSDLSARLDLPDYDAHLQRALREHERACKGDPIAITAVLSALEQIDRIYRTAANRHYRDECVEECEWKVLGADS